MGKCCPYKVLNHNFKNTDDCVLRLKKKNHALLKVTATLYAVFLFICILGKNKFEIIQVLGLIFEVKG